MEIVDLDSTNEHAWSVCLKEWDRPPPDEQARTERVITRRVEWCRRLPDRGLRVKLALTDDGTPGGMIQYLPIEYSHADGQDLYFVTCTWVHGYDEGPGNLQGKGMGKALLAAAEEDVPERGAKGLVAWGNTFPGWMPVAWLLKRGYEEADRDGPRVLVWKRFASDAVAPLWRVVRKVPEAIPGKVTVTAFVNPACAVDCNFYERVTEVVAEIGGDVRFETIDTSLPEALAEWGVSNGLFVNGRQITGGIEELVQVIDQHSADLAGGALPD